MLVSFVSYFLDLVKLTGDCGSFSWGTK